MSKITTEHLTRQAIVYVRQSTLDQVHNNLESQRRQYALADRARSLGWKNVVVIDDDLGRSGSGSHRPGFERLLAALCEGIAGAVFCIDASRLARNGRDWHTLLEFCRLVNTLIIDEDGIYDVRQSNDRLVLGMKGTLSEMELSTLRQRSQEALMQKAKRGELFTMVPIGYLRAPNDRIEKDPDKRIRKSIALVFQKFRELGSVRQVLLWLRQERIELPAVRYGESGRGIVWKLPVYNTIHHIMRNPAYAGTYVHGRTKTTTRLEKTRQRSVRSRAAPQEWKVRLLNHHDGYITWDEYQVNQRQIAHNASMNGPFVRGPARHGQALLAGILRCGQCGRKLHVRYSGGNSECVRYACKGAATNHGAGNCISFGAPRAERLCEEELLRRLTPLSIEAALSAIEKRERNGDEKIKQRELSLEHARFEVNRARRQYDAVDPDNRMVAAELERRWNEALKTCEALQKELEDLQSNRPPPIDAATRHAVLKLGQDVSALWYHPKSDPKLKKRIVRTVLQEIVAKVEGERIVLVLHWQGGDHTQLDFLRSKSGQTRYNTPKDVITLVQELARILTDRQVVCVLNRVGLRTAFGHTWTVGRLRSFRGKHKIPVYNEGDRLARGELTADEASKILKASPSTVRRWLELKTLKGKQACPTAPWIIQRSEVERFAAQVDTHGRRAENGHQITLELQ